MQPKPPTPNHVRKLGRYDKLKRKAIKRAWKSPTRHAIVREGKALVLAGHAHEIRTARGKEVTAATIVFTTETAGIARAVMATWKDRMAVDPKANPATALADAAKQVDIETTHREAAVRQAKRRARGRRTSK
jgi:hypothetical protein